MVYGAALEMRFGGNPIEGSNPSLSAITSRMSTRQVASPQNSSRQGIVQVCACRPGLRVGSMECQMPAKRILSAALALLVAASFATPSGAQALSADGFEYTVASGAATLTGCTSTCPTTLVIPATLGGYSVTSIGDSAFFSIALTSVSIPNSVTSIGSYAFYASGLTSLTLPNTLVSIADYAFEANPLTTVSIPDSVETIGIGAFYRNSLTVLQLGNQVISIGDSAFADLGPNENSISSLIIPDSVASIGTNAFSGNALTSVTFLGNAPTDGGNVFLGNSDLSFVTRSSTATGWGLTWSGVPVVTEELPPTNRDAAPWLMTLLLLVASAVAAVGIQLRQRESRRN